jgi:hypothetical protein
MKTVGCLKDLEEFGIYPLTGEACGLMMRILCDFDERGRQVLARRFGNEAFAGGEAWNTSTKGHKHVGSIMLCRDDYLDLGVFGLLMTGHRWAYRVEYKEQPGQVIRRLSLALKGLLVAASTYKHKEQQKADEDLANNIRNAEDAWMQCPSSEGSFLISMGAVYGFGKEDEAEAIRWQELVRKEGYSFRCYSGTGDAQGGFRNQHQFSGRTE